MESTLEARWRARKQRDAHATWNMYAAQSHPTQLDARSLTHRALTAVQSLRQPDVDAPVIPFDPKRAVRCLG